MKKIKLKKGVFISFEGIDGSGKSTQINLLFKSLKGLGYDCLLTREPGGTKESELIRNILLSSSSIYKWDNISELLLIMVARREHYCQFIKPAIFDGKIVLCDRFLDSTSAYQGAAKNIPMDTINLLSEITIENFLPDITFLLDLDIINATKRISERKEKNKFDSKDVSFYKKVRSEYMLLSKKYERIKKISAIEPINNIKDTILNITIEKIKMYEQ